MSGAGDAGEEVVGRAAERGGQSGEQGCGRSADPSLDVFAAFLVASALVLVFRVDRFLPRLADAGCRAVPAAAASVWLGASAPERELQTGQLTTERERTRHEVREVGIGWGGLDVRVESLERETERTETQARIRGE